MRFGINPLILLRVTGSGGNDSGQWLEGFPAQIERLSILKGSHAAVKAGAEGSIIVFSTDLLRGNANPTCAVDQSKFEIADGNATVSRKFSMEVRMGVSGRLKFEMHKIQY